MGKESSIIGVMLGQASEVQSSKEFFSNSLIETSEGIGF